MGGQKYQYLYSRGMTASVRADVSRNPTIPSWFSEMLPLSFDVALGVGKFRRFVSERLKKKNECVEFIEKYLYCKKEIAEEIYNYFAEQDGFSEIPDESKIVIEKLDVDENSERATVSGTAYFKNGTKESRVVELRKENGKWRIVYQ